MPQYWRPTEESEDGNESISSCELGKMFASTRYAEAQRIQSVFLDFPCCVKDCAEARPVFFSAETAKSVCFREERYVCSSNDPDSIY